MSTLSKLTLLALLAVLVCGLESDSVAQSDLVLPKTAAETESAARDGAKEIEKLILQLGSSSYSVRQAATERLWEFGNEAKPLLERAAQAGNSEVAKRTKDILSVLAMGVDFRTKPEIAKLVLDFQSNENQGRLEIIRRLIEQDKIQLAFDLLERVKNASLQKELFTEAFNFKALLDRLARADRWEEFELIYGHPLTFEHYRDAGILYHHLNGTLDPKVDKLRRAIEEKEKAGIAVESAELQMLVSIYKFQGKFDQAEAYASKISEPSLRFAILNMMILEQGDWKRIAENMVGPDDPVKPEDGKIMVTPSQRALVYRFLGDEIKYDETVNALKEELAKLEKNKKGDAEAKVLRIQLANIGSACQDWDLVEANIDHEEKYRAFQIYLSHNRIQQAFDALGVGNDVEERSLWFKRRLRKLTSLGKKIERLREQDLGDEATEEYRRLWDVCLEVCDVLGGLGLTDEAVLHFQTLYPAFVADGDTNRRIQIVYRLVQLERFDEAWQLIGMSVTRRELREFDNYLFPYKLAAAGFWLNQLKSRYPDNVERLKIVSGILNSPLGTTSDFDLEMELASVRSNPAANVRGRIDYQVSKVFGFHGDEEARQLHLKMAEELGDYAAKRETALAATVDGDPQVVVDYYDKMWHESTSRSSTGFAPILAAEAFVAMGESKPAMLRICLSFAQWKASYRNSGTISSLASLEKLHLISDFLKLDVYSIEEGRISNERNRAQLSESLIKSDPAANVRGKQMSMFYDMASSSREIESWAEFGKELNILMAKQLIVKKEFDQAVRLLLRSNDFRPGDPSLIEGIVPELDKAGANKQADELFEKTTEFYFDLLQQYPDSSLHRNNYAWACACANRRMQHMQRHSAVAVAMRPNSPTYIDTLAEVYFLLGDHAQAIELSKRCIELNPLKKHYQQQLKRFSEAK